MKPVLQVFIMRFCHMCITHALTYKPIDVMFRTCSTATVAHVRQAALEVIKILPWQANLEVSICTCKAKPF